MGASNSKSESIQAAQNYTAQQFSASCEIDCENKINGLNIVLNHTETDGINISQKCSTSGNCMISSGIDALSTIKFKAGNSSNAKNAGGGLFGPILNFDSSSSTGTQDIKNTMIQSNKESCNFHTENTMSDVSILAGYSKISKGINISQEGGTNAKCQLDNVMSATSLATGSIENESNSGGGKKGDKFSGIGMITGGILAIIIIIIVAKMLSHNQAQEKIGKKKCPQGVDPVLVGGKQIFDQYGDIVCHK